MKGYTAHLGYGIEIDLSLAMVLMDPQLIRSRYGAPAPLKGESTAEYLERTKKFDHGMVLVKSERDGAEIFTVFARKFYSSAKMGGEAVKVELNRIHAESPEAYFRIKDLFLINNQVLDHSKYGFLLLVTKGS